MLGLNADMQGVGFYSGFSSDSFEYKEWAREANRWEDNLSKAYNTGEGIINPSNTAAAPADSTNNLRVQFLRDRLETMSIEEDDAALMKLLPKPRVYSNTYEWSIFRQYGGAGDGFTPENGTNNDYGVTAADDVFMRLIRQVKFMAAVREIGLVSTLVKNVKDPEEAAEMGATRELIAKCNLALYTGDSRKAFPQFDGLIRQFLDWVSPVANAGYNQPSDQVILYDAGNQPIDQILLNELMNENRKLFGRASRIVQSVQGKADSSKLMMAFQRTNMGGGSSRAGIAIDEYDSDFGIVKVTADVMLRPNLPLVFDGAGISGKPRFVADWTVAQLAPIATSATSAAAESAGTGAFWLNLTQSGVNPAAPAVPSGDGNQSNNLAAGVGYYYGVSAVFQGRESSFLPIGATAMNGNFTGNTAVTVTAGQIVRIILGAGVTGTALGTTPLSHVKFRIYRTGLRSGPPTSLNDFNLLHETGCNTTAATTSISFDNGMYIPGADNAFLLTEKKNGVDAVFLAQLLPLMKRTGLPSKVLSDPLALLLFVAPIILCPRHHIWIRNVGRAQL